MSRLPFELLLALRYLRPKRTFVSIITLISVLGVTLGVAVLVIVISVMTGFDKDLRDKILGFNAHMKIYQLRPGTHERTTMTNYTKAMDLVNANPDVKGATPFILGPVMLQTEPPSGDPQIAAPWLRGIDPQTEGKVSLLTSNVFGSADLSGHGLLVGTDFAGNMGLQLGDRVAIYSPRDLEKMVKSHKKGQTEELIPATDYEVRGIFDAGYYEYNANVIVTSLENAQDLYRLDDDVHGLMVLLKDPYQADAVRAKLQHTLGPGFYITTWSEENTAMGAVM